MATTVVTRGAGASGRIDELERKVAELEAELEEVEDSIVGEELFIMDGYLVSVRATRGGGHLAVCPTLHAATEQATQDEALKDLREAMAVAVDGRKQSGHPIPPKDTEARWLR